MSYLRWFKDISIKDVPLVGGKNASLGEMYSQLTQKGIKVPNGFAITAEAYFDFLKEGGIYEEIKRILNTYNLRDVKELQQAGKLIRSLILKTPLPQKLQAEVLSAYQKLSQEYGEKNVDVAVRSSATAEDLPSASFAGQHETYLNVSGPENLLQALKKSYSSLFLDRAITYRIEKGFDHLKIAISTGVQKMVRSDLGSSGIIFTLDTETGFKNVIVINSIYGLGELIVKGKITPDEFLVFKPTLKQGYPAIIRKDLGKKTLKYVYNSRGGIKSVKVSLKDQKKFSLEDQDILTLANWALLIEEHYSQKNQRWTPQDIEWAKDGKTGQLYIVQSRPETVHSLETAQVYQEYRLKTNKPPLLTGIAIGNKVTSGKVHLIENVKKLSQFKKGEILVTRMTDPDWTTALPLAAGIITDEGGKTCFAGETKILTDKGLLSIKEIVNCLKTDKLKVLSLNKQTLQLEWRRIIKGYERQSKIIETVISQTGRMRNNILKVTPDHKFLTFENRVLISEEIEKIIAEQKGILSIEKIPSLNSTKIKISPKKAYLMGAIFTDGNIRISSKNAAITFVQKPTSDKNIFINRVKQYFKEVYDYELHLSKENPSLGAIRGKIIHGNATIQLRCYRKNIAKDLITNKEHLINILMTAKEEALFNFLAGVIDGDGTYNGRANRINIFCSQQYLFEAIVIILLRLGINYQVTFNRNIFNIQIVDKLDEIFSYTARVKGKSQRIIMDTRFFYAKSLLADLKYRANCQDRILSYLNQNLLIDAKKIQNYVIPQIAGSPENHQLTKIINSPLKMYRVTLQKKVQKQKVYNLEVEKNHNYLVFTSRLTPVLVENCHAAIISRELGIPCLVGTGKATKILKNNQEITIDCSSGAEGKIFSGKVPFEVKKYELKTLPKLSTKISLNLGAPDIAFQTSFLPNDGVGLAREEFIIAEKIKIHPLALYYYKQIKSQKFHLPKFLLGKNLGRQEIKKSELNGIIRKIDKMTVEHKDKKEYFITELAEGIAQIAAAFYPKEVIVRFSDFKTNEYRQLIGGSLFEPQEENPMLGWRGASRYYDPRFKPAFEMECLALKRVIETFGLNNISVMVPFCRTPAEGKKVKDIIRNYLKDAKIYVMAEIPANALLIKEFLEIFDGMSIGSNDLAQLVLGIDRDNAGLAKIGNENNEAVKKMIKDIIQACRQQNKYVGICGQAPSDYPEFADFLVQAGITALSLNPDSVIKTILYLSKSKEEKSS